MENKHYQYLVIGGGMTSEAAVRGIRQVDPAGTIGLISAESHPPYNRPPLSKGLWKGEPETGIWLDPPSGATDLILGRGIRRIEPDRKQVVDDLGSIYSYDRLLLATGGTPRRLPFGDERIIYFRTLDDYRRLRTLTGRGKRFVVIGGGFIGGEIAAALAVNGLSVTLVFPEDGIGQKVFPRDLSLFLNDYYREKGVALHPSDTVTGIADRPGGLAVRTRSGAEIPADGIIAGLGIRPNVELAETAGLPTDDGIVVDEFLRTRDPDIYAAGDVAAFPSAALGRRIRVEHEDAARSMGVAAGRALAGQAEPYRHLPAFYSDLFDLGYEAVGMPDPRLETVADWQEPFRQGVIYSLQAGRVRGIILWNTWEQVDAARRLIESEGPWRPEDLRGRLPA
jgi:3-phenylpropionate/trans-cinnamate dioxygenase ferredoxin reductase subunit